MIDKAFESDMKSILKYKLMLADDVRKFYDVNEETFIVWIKLNWNLPGKRFPVIFYHIFLR